MLHVDKQCADNLAESDTPRVEPEPLVCLHRHINVLCFAILWKPESGHFVTGKRNTSGLQLGRAAGHLPRIRNPKSRGYDIELPVASNILSLFSDSVFPCHNPGVSLNPMLGSVKGFIGLLVGFVSGFMACWRTDWNQTCC